MSTNLYRRGKTWYARVTVCGKEHRRSLQTSEKAEASRRFKAWEKELTAQAHFGVSRIGWREAVVSFAQETGAKSVKASTLKRYLCSLTMLGDLPAGLKGEKIEDMFLDQIDRKVVSRIVSLRRGDGATDATIRRDLSAGSRIFAAAAVADEDLSANPFLDYMRAASNAGTLRERRDPIVLPDAKDIRLVIDLLPGNFRYLVEAALLTGMRQQELVKLTRTQINAAGRQLLLTATKTDRARAVALSPAALTLFESIPAALRCQWVFWHSSNEGATAYENVSSRFHGYVKTAAKVAHLRQAPFRRFRFHDLRHFYAVQYLKDGGSIYDLQKQLGHASITTTEVYLDYLTPDEASAVKRGSAQKSAHAI